MILKCNEDCFHCQYSDCIKDETPSERRRRKNYERYLFRRKNNLCVQCGKKLINNKSRCVDCQTRFNSQRKERYKKFPELRKRALRLNLQLRYKNKEQGKCWQCAKPTTDGKTYCDECLANFRSKYAAQKAIAKEKKPRDAKYFKQLNNALWASLKKG